MEWIRQPWRGVDASSFDALEATLKELSQAYLEEQQLTRQTVIAAKDKAGCAARTRVAPEKRAIKSEMVDWMLVWLGDPLMFPEWVALRRGVLSADPANPARPTQP